MNGEHKPDSAQVAKLVAAAALALLIITNFGWLVAYSSLSQRLIATPNDLSASPRASATPSTQPSASAVPSTTPATKGTITGNVGFPASTTPAEVVCAIGTTDATVKICVDHPAGTDLAYSLSVSPGSYYVYASLKQPQGDFTTSYKAYYNEYVACQQTGNCAAGLHNHYVAVTVAAGQVASGIDPTDWYALGLGQ